jgi:hypothetical protein
VLLCVTHVALVLPCLRGTNSAPQAFYILDEVLMAGELQETSKKAVLRVVASQDALVEEAKKGKKKS